MQMGAGSKTPRTIKLGIRWWSVKISTSQLLLCLRKGPFINWVRGRMGPIMGLYDLERSFNSFPFRESNSLPEEFSSKPGRNIRVISFKSWPFQSAVSPGWESWWTMLQRQEAGWIWQKQLLATGYETRTAGSGARGDIVVKALRCKPAGRGLIPDSVIVIFQWHNPSGPLSI